MLFKFNKNIFSHENNRTNLKYERPHIQLESEGKGKANKSRRKLKNLRLKYIEKALIYE